MRTAIVWFRRDLRLTDNPALVAALAVAERVVAIYIHAPEEETPWSPTGASRWWLHHSLAALDLSLRSRGARLVLARGPSLEALLAVARQSGAAGVHWNRSYEPAVIARDRAVEDGLRAAGFGASSHPGNLLFEPSTIRNAAGAPFRVFSPFWRAVQARIGLVAPPTPPPVAIPGATGAPPGVPLAALSLLPRIRWDAAFAACWQPGEAGAIARLDRFLAGAIGDYAEHRDRPDLEGTSRLSPHLHFGELTPRQACAAIRLLLAPGGAPSRGADSFLRELGWREFAHHLLHAFPHTTDAPMDPRFADFAWHDDPRLLTAWQQGATGIPLVDAGMRELWQTGWMHNRVRMVVASMLTKNLGIGWRAGARWFHGTLLDADLANNTLGWQWTAGCGADAAPYYRIFNPVLQAERFDPARRYLRRWLPELDRLPDEWLHRPFAAPATVLAAAGIKLCIHYPAPVVDLVGSRERALGAWQQLKGPPAPAVAPPRLRPGRTRG